MASKPNFKVKMRCKIRITMCLRRRSKMSRMRSTRQRIKSPSRRKSRESITVDSG